jgi:HAMP domain-containing protein
MNSRKQRKVRNYLLDLGFQLRITAVVVLACVGIFAVLGYLYQREYRTSQRIDLEIAPLVEAASGQAQAPEDSLASLDQELGQELDRRGNRLLMIMFGAVALLVLALGALSIVLTHRAAGPIRAMMNFVRAVKAGDFSSPRPLRKGDEFAYLHTEMADLARVLTENRDRQRTVVGAALAHLHGGGPEAAAKAAAELAKLEQNP